MATMKKTDSLTAVTSATKEEDNTPRVRIFLQPRESHGEVTMDQYEHVTVNGVTSLVRRGEHVNVTVPVYMQLRNRFPFL